MSVALCSICLHNYVAQFLRLKTSSDFTLLQKFCQFLKTGITTESQLIKSLEKVEDHLSKNGSRFMLSDTLTRADCYLLPTLQHIRVAGKVWPLLT